MRAGIVVNVTRADRLRLEAIVADRSAPQKHVWRAKVIVATADGCGTAEIMRRSGKSKPCDALSDEAPAEGCHRDGPARARLQSHAGHEHLRREAAHRGDPDVRGAHRRNHIAHGGPGKPPRFQLAIVTTC